MVDNGTLILEPKVAFQYDLLLETAAVVAGVDVLYKLHDKIWIGTPVNRPGLVAFVKGLELPAPIGEIKPFSSTCRLGLGFKPLLKSTCS